MRTKILILIWRFACRLKSWAHWRYLKCPSCGDEVSLNGIVWCDNCGAPCCDACRDQPGIFLYENYPECCPKCGPSTPDAVVSVPAPENEQEVDDA
jgi:hypothetical protein